MKSIHCDLGQAFDVKIAHNVFGNVLDSCRHTQIGVVIPGEAAEVVPSYTQPRTLPA
jgi:hypothetical protein